MKKSFYYLFIFQALIFTACSPKYLEGTYKTFVPEGNISFVNETYTFTKEGDFSYQFSSDDIASNSYGEGQYTLRGNQLQLQYRDIAQELFEPSFEAFYGEERPGDSLIMRLNFKLENDKPLPGLVIFFFQGVEECLSPVVTNAGGQAYIRTTKDMIPFRFETHPIGLTPFDYTVRDPYHWRVDAVLKPGFGKIYSIEDEVKSFKIRYKAPDLWLKSEQRTERLQQEK